MKTASRHQGTPRHLFRTNKQGVAVQPDRIIMPVSNTTPDNRPHTGRTRTMEYTNFEEVKTVSSDVYDELVFLEYADEDASRIRRKQA